MIRRSRGKIVPASKFVHRDFPGKRRVGIARIVRDLADQSQAGRQQNLLPLVLEFKDISDSGQATVVATVLYHGHKSTELSNDAASAEGDSYLTTDPITTTFDPNYGFEFNYTPGGDGTKVEVKATPVQSQSDNATQFKVEVTSRFANQGQFRDTYTITKSA